MVKKSSFVHDCIKAGVTPPPETLNDARLIWSKARDIEVQASDQVVGVYNEVMALRRQIKVLETERDLRILHMQAFMGTAGVLKYENKTLATWKNDKDGVALDKKRLEEKHEQAYKDSLVPKRGSKKFLLKELKGAK